MAHNGSVPSSLNVSTETLASSQLLSSSASAISTTSRHGSSSGISKIYRQSSTLFLTRRLPESLSTILPVITPPSTDSPGGPTEPAPIYTASRTTRVKVWSLYLTILNAIVELDPDEGKQAFGTQDWRALVAKVRDGQVWEEVVKYGYGGIEGNVDPDVVINLATLLLAHAPSQRLNQQRLENYLAASATPTLDIAAHFTNSQGTPHSRRRNPSRTSGTDTPRDLNSRVKILELYTLHALLRNDEWDYAREFITMSEVLDEERRDAFLQALESLHEEKLALEKREQEEQLLQEEQLQREIEETRRKRLEEEERQKQQEAEQWEQSNKGGSEIDYGIEASPPSNASNKARSTRGEGTKSPKPSRGKASPNSRSSAPAAARKPAVSPPTLAKRASIIVNNLVELVQSMTISFRSNPTIILRMLAFIIGLLILLGRKDIRLRVKRMMGNAWNKVRATAGMGVKVSYI